mgnify:CR=1 FL=1
MIRFALIVASTLGFVLTAALGNLMTPLLRAFRVRQEENEPPTMGGLCLMVGTLAAVGVGWTAACVAQPELLGTESLLTTRLLIALFGALCFGAVGLADDVVRLRHRSPLGLRRPVRLALEAASGTLVLALLGLLTLIKCLVLHALGALSRMHPSHRWTFALALAQGSEFAFVLLALVQQGQLFPNKTLSLLTLVVALSMALTPLLLILNDRVIQPWFDYRNQADTPEHEQPELVEHPVIIAGFGRFGQIVGRLLHGHGIGTTILEQDASQIEMLRKYGYQVFYGDASRLDLLHAAGAHKARLLVLSINDPATSLEVIEMVKKHFPHLKILARAQDRPHAHEILRHGVDSVHRETLGSAVDLGVEALTQLGFRANQAWRAGQVFKQYDNRLLREQVNYLDDEHTYINKSLQYREILSDLLQDDQEGQERTHAHNWNSGLPDNDKEAI